MKIFAIFVSLFLISCSSLNKKKETQRVPSVADSKTNVIKNVEVRSKDSAILDDGIPMDDFNRDFVHELFPDVKENSVLWHGIAGSYADWCSDLPGVLVPLQEFYSSWQSV